MVRAGIFCFAAVCIPFVASAQASDAQANAGMTLQQVLEAAATNYPAIQAAQAHERAAKGTVAVAKTAYLPRADVLWQTNRATANNVYGLLLPQGVIPSISGPVLPSDVSRNAWSSGGAALLSWQPFDFGARAARVNAAQMGSEAATQAAALTMLEVTANAGSAFFDLAAARQLVLVARANVNRIETFARVVHVLVDNTLRPGADASLADAQLALARNQLVQAQTQEAVRRAALSLYMGNTALEPEINDAQLLATLPAAPAATAKLTLHPAALEAGALLSQQQENERALGRSYVPVFTALGSVSGRGAGTALDGQFPGGTAGLAPDTFNWAAGLQVTFPAFDYFTIKEQKKVQQANVESERAHYQQALDNISVAVKQAEATLAGARLIAANTPYELTAARTSEEQQQARYRSGLATVVDVSAAEAVLAQAESDDRIAHLSVWRAQFGVAIAQGDLQPFQALLKSQP